eukprot:SAG11_NODE_511_length_8847_cov_3.611911_5_plen_502_part_00
MRTVVRVRYASPRGRLCGRAVWLFCWTAAHVPRCAGPLKQGWLFVENQGKLSVGREQHSLLPAAQGQKWTRRWFCLWPVEPHPSHGQFLFEFVDRNAKAAEGCIQIITPVVRQPQTPRENYYSLRLNADMVVSASVDSGVRVQNKKMIIGTTDVPDGAPESGEQRMRMWIRALRSVGPRWQRAVAAREADCSGWLLCREKKLGLAVGWARRWCELRGNVLSHFRGDGDMISGSMNLGDFGLHMPKLPKAHRAFEMVVVAKPEASIAVTRSSFSKPSMSKPKKGILQKEPGRVFHCFAALDELGYNTWTTALGKTMHIATAFEEAGLSELIGGWGLGKGKAEAEQQQLSQHEIRVRLEDFQVMQLLGQGGFGAVYLVQPREHFAHRVQEEPDLEEEEQMLYAMKAISKRQLVKEGQTARAQQERKLLQKLSNSGCAFIVRLEWAFQTPESVFLVTEFVSVLQSAFQSFFAAAHNACSFSLPWCIATNCSFSVGIKGARRRHF